MHIYEHFHNAFIFLRMGDFFCNYTAEIKIIRPPEQLNR